MANYSTLKDAIADVIKTNGKNAITGAILQSALLSMIDSLGVAGFQFKGLATPETNPGTPDQNVFYLATTPGTYSNFNANVVDNGKIVIFTYKGSWSKTVVYSGPFANAEYLLTLNLTGDNVFDPNYIRPNTMVRTSRPWDIAPYTGMYTTRFYKVPSTCEKITISGLSGTGIKYARLSKEPTDTSESIAFAAPNTEFSIDIDAERRQYPYFCVTVYRGSETPNLSTVKISFGDIRDNIESVRAHLKTQIDSLVTGLQYDSSVLTTANNFMCKLDGQTRKHEEFDCGLDYYPVTPGDHWLCKFYANDSAAVCFYNSNKQYINAYWQSLTSTPTEYVVPENAAFVRFCNRRTVIASPYFKPILAYDDLTTLTEKVNALVLPEFTRPLVRLYPQTKLPVCSFQFDDIPAKDSELVELFESYKLTCAFAFIASTSNITNRGPVYKEYQQRGFQIMNHSVDGKIFNLTNYSYASALETIMTALNRIQDAGMVCNGFVSPSSEMEPSFMPILKMSHAYAFTSTTSSPTANGRTQDTCNLHRYSLQSHTLTQIQQFIDDCIANDQIITFYEHASDLVEGGDTSVFSIARIAAVIEYCIAKRNAGLLYVGGTDDCVKYFFDL